MYLVCIRNSMMVGNINFVWNKMWTYYSEYQYPFRVLSPGVINTKEGNPSALKKQNALWYSNANSFKGLVFSYMLWFLWFLAKIFCTATLSVETSDHFIRRVFINIRQGKFSLREAVLTETLMLRNIRNWFSEYNLLRYAYSYIFTNAKRVPLLQYPQPIGFKVWIPFIIHIMFWESIHKLI